MTDITGDDIKKAWDRVARTADGLTIYRHFQKVCLEKPPSLDGSALPFFEGRRSLAFDLMANMSEGVADNDRAAVTFATAKPAAVSPSRGAGPRITRDHYIPGYDILPWGDAEPTGSNGAGSTGGNT